MVAEQHVTGMQHAGSSQATGAAAPDAATLPIDVAETADGFLLRAYLPGLRPDDAEVAVDGSSVTIRARREVPAEALGLRWLQQEMSTGEFARTVELPAPARADAADWWWADGVLLVRLARVTATTPEPPATGELTANPAANAELAATAPGATVARPDLPEDEVAEQSMDSFPASDPPSYTPQRIGGAREA